MKNPTSWVINSNANTNARKYDSGSIVYDSASLTFDGITTGQSQITIEIPTAWASSLKNGTSWIANSLAYTNTDPYDTTGIYDTVDNYDAVVAGQSFITDKKAITWNNV